MLESFKKKIEDLEAQSLIATTEYNLLTAQVNNLDIEIETHQKQIEDYTKAKEVLNELSETVRDKAILILQQTVTPMLQAISEEPYLFEIVPSVLRGKPNVDFWIVENINGEVSYQDPIRFCGGGFVDIISSALRYAFLDIYDGGVNNAILLDEPGRMISEQASSKFADFIKYLGTSFNRQTIMCTHSSNMAAFADRTITVNKINGKSQVTIN